jgi:hypothetical protein
MRNDMDDLEEELEEEEGWGMQEALKTLLKNVIKSKRGGGIPVELRKLERVESFEKAGVLTSDPGLVLTMHNGIEMLITIQVDQVR